MQREEDAAITVAVAGAVAELPSASSRDARPLEPPPSRIASPVAVITRYEVATRLLWYSAERTAQSFPCASNAAMDIRIQSEPHSIHSIVTRAICALPHIPWSESHPPSESWRS